LSTRYRPDLKHVYFNVNKYFRNPTDDRKFYASLSDLFNSSFDFLSLSPNICFAFD